MYTVFNRLALSFSFSFSLYFCLSLTVCPSFSYFLLVPSEEVFNLTNCALFMERIQVFHFVSLLKTLNINVALTMNYKSNNKFIYEISTNLTLSTRTFYELYNIYIIIIIHHSQVSKYQRSFTQQETANNDKPKKMII